VISPAPVVEVIACSVSDAIEAQQGGAGRLEIIRDLQRGGLTPPLKLVRDILEAVTIPVRVMLRGSDSYHINSEVEVKELCSAARELSELGVDGVVLGFIRAGSIDIALTDRVLSFAPRLRATFHHAFEDAVDPLSAIRILKQIKQVDRILTFGGRGEWPEKIKRLARYEEAAGREIQILAGGGIDLQSIPMICEGTRIREFHIGRAARKPANASGEVRSELVKALVEIAQDSFRY
jgi:copper homeostasis protein